MYNTASIRWIWNDWLRQILILDHYDFHAAQPEFAKGQDVGSVHVFDIELRIGGGNGIWVDAVYDGVIGNYLEPGLYEDYRANMLYVLNNFTTWLELIKR